MSGIQLGNITPVQAPNYNAAIGAYSQAASVDQSGTQGFLQGLKSGQENRRLDIAAKTAQQENMLNTMKVEQAKKQYIADTAYGITQLPEEKQQDAYNQATIQMAKAGILNPADVKSWDDGGSDLVKIAASQSPLGLKQQKAAQDAAMFNLNVQSKLANIKQSESSVENNKLLRQQAEADNFTNASKEFILQRTAKQRVDASAKDPSAAGDLALIFNYMKVLDPGSTVREGEFATAQNSGSIDSRAIAAYNKVLKGERLSSTQRSDFLDRSTKLYDTAEASHLSVAEQYKQRAERMGLDPRNVLTDYTGKLYDKENKAIGIPTFEEISKEKPGITPQVYQAYVDAARKKVSAQAQTWAAMK